MVKMCKGDDYVSDLQAKEYKTFEEIKRIRDDGSEYWNARELSQVLQYAEWRNFSKVLDRAKLACQNSGQEIKYHFVEVNKTIIMPKNATKKIVDYELSRYAELIANLFRISQTEEKLKKDKIHTSIKATETHYEVGSKVRKAIEDIGGTMPEDLPTP